CPAGRSPAHLSRILRRNRTCSTSPIEATPPLAGLRKDWATSALPGHRSLLHRPIVLPAATRAQAAEIPHRSAELPWRASTGEPLRPDRHFSPRSTPGRLEAWADPAPAAAIFRNTP